MQGAETPGKQQVIKTACKPPAFHPNDIRII